MKYRPGARLRPPLIDFKMVKAETIAKSYTSSQDLYRKLYRAGSSEARNAQVS